MCSSQLCLKISPDIESAAVFVFTGDSGCELLFLVCNLKPMDHYVVVPVLNKYSW
jgi:hypothetical protein